MSLVSGKAMPPGQLSDSMVGRFMQVHEMARLRMVDTRDIHLIMGGSIDTAPAAGTYLDFPDEDEPCPYCGHVEVE